MVNESNSDGDGEGEGATAAAQHHENDNEAAGTAIATSSLSLSSSLSQQPPQQQQEELLMVLFLDIDGVLLPFNNNCEQQEPKSSTCCSAGSLFPGRTLTALAKILDHNYTINKNKNNNTSVTMQLVRPQIVLSSTWRVRESYRRDILDSLRVYGYQYGCSAMLDLRDDFFDITDPNYHGERQHEIYKWLQSHQQNKQQQSKQQSQQSKQSKNLIAWIAIDDEELIAGKANIQYRHIFHNHVIKTESSIGLTDSNADTAIKLLQQQIDNN